MKLIKSKIYWVDIAYRGVTINRAFLVKANSVSEVEEIMQECKPGCIINRVETAAAACIEKSTKTVTIDI